MEMPGYTDYGKMYEMNPGAFMQAQEQVGLAQQFQQQKQLQAEQTTQGMGLDNMFKQDTYGDRVRAGTAAADLAGFNAREQGVKTRINEKTEGLQLSAAEKDLVMKAKKSELDQLELTAQQLAYDPDPQKRAAGEQILRMHRDFIKMRDEGGIRAEAATQAQRHAKELEGMRQAGQVKLENIRSTNRVAAKTAAKGNIDNVYDQVRANKLSPDKAAVTFGAAAMQAQASGDMDAFNEYSAAAAQMERLALTTKPDAQVGKPNLGELGGIPVNSPRPPTFPQGPLSSRLYPNGQPNPAAQGAAVPNQRHIAFLKANPGRVAEFEAKFGPGSAKQYLGK